MLPTEVVRRFTPEELKQFDGKEGRPAYVAYHGKVYDVTASKLWRNGVHVRAHSAGEDLSAAMPAAPHEDDVMESFSVVGVLATLEDELGPPLHPWWVRISLDNHLHPIAVHFPTALGAICAVFGLLSLPFFRSSPGLYEGFQHAAFWCLLVCLVGAVPAILTGWLSWYHNYSAVWTPIYRVKWGGSIVLVVLSAAAVALKFAALDGTAVVEPAGGAFWAYTGLQVLIAATVTVLGHYGGKITFPS